MSGLRFGFMILKITGTVMNTATLPRWAIYCLYAAGLVIAVTLLIQHWVHVPLILPLLVFLACPLMHLFMHHGHHRHSRNRDRGAPPRAG
jgi:hypothetical protein